MRSSADADVLVVGGGPAGAWAAYCLAQKGARVRLFDHSHPREKPCGGGVTGRALALIERAIVVESLGAVRVTDGRFEDPRAASACVPMAAGAQPDASLFVTDRRRFDGALLEAAKEAGVEHHAERVTDARVEVDGPRIQTARATYRGGWILGADGANSLVRRRLQRPFRRDQISIACGVFAHGCSASTIVIRFVSDPPGYLWSFPRCDHLAIGACAQADVTSVATLRSVTSRWLEASGLAAGARLEPYAWPIPSLQPADFVREPCGGTRYLLVGDAAGLVDPITREGIYFALLSGQLAAAAVARGGDVAAHYRMALDQHIHPELERAARLKRGFFRGPFTALLVDALRESRAVRAVMVDLVAGHQPYRTLKARLVRTFEWRLAWQLLRLERGRSPALPPGATIPQ